MNSHISQLLSPYTSNALISGLQTQESWPSFTIQTLQPYLVSQCQKAINISLAISFSAVIVIVQSLSCVWLCKSMNCNTPGFPVLHHLLEFAETYVYWVGNADKLPISSSRHLTHSTIHPLLPLFPPALNLSQHWGLFQWVGSSHQVAKVLEPQHQSFQWIVRVDFL